MLLLTQDNPENRNMESGFNDPKQQDPEAYLKLYSDAHQAAQQGHDKVQLTEDEAPFASAVQDAYGDAGAGKPRITVVTKPAIMPELQRHRPSRLKRAGAALLAAGGVAAGASGAQLVINHAESSHVAAPQPTHEQGLPPTTPEQAAARAALANRPFDNPAITSIRQKTLGQTGRSALHFGLRVPDSPEGRRVLEQYAHDDAVRWLTDSHQLVGKLVYKDKSGKHASFIDSTLRDAGHFQPQDGKATADLVLHTQRDAPGTEIALYTKNTASTFDETGVTDQTGYQSTHTTLRLTVENGERVWEEIPNNFPDMPGRPELTPPLTSSPQPLQAGN